MPVNVVSWNVNSVRVRLPLLQQFLRQYTPDVVCLQEIKCVDQNFPRTALEDCGYNVYIHGQKTYNGVAILSRLPCEVVHCGLPTLPNDPQARYIEVLHTDAQQQVRRIASVYLPNGNPVADKYAYKQQWMQAFEEHAAQLLTYEEQTLLCGDYNIIPEEIDVAKPADWVRDALFLPATRDVWRRLCASGWSDAVRLLAPTQEQIYTFWDYRSGAFARNTGIRIDHVLASPLAAQTLTGYEVYSAMRGEANTSDHAPVGVTCA